jgi:hypothetical protein
MDPGTGGEARALDKLDLTPVEVKPEFAIAADVIVKAAGAGIILLVDDLRADLVCEQCGQSVICLRNQGGSFWLTTAAISGGVISHLIQVHGWTREGGPLHGGQHDGGREAGEAAADLGYVARHGGPDSPGPGHHDQECDRGGSP